MSDSLEQQRACRMTTLLLLGFALACSSATPQGQTSGDIGGTGGQTPSGGGGRGGQTPVGGSGQTPGGTSDGGGQTPNGGGGSSAAGGNLSSDGCDAPGLTWKTARKTWYESYPDPGSEECVKYNGCEWAGQFAACDGKKTEAWVKGRNIAAAFPDFAALSLHDLCLKSGDRTLVVTVLDTCGDDDCDGCCTQNKGDADALIDLEKYTNERWGVEDGPITWADLGPTRSAGCR